MKRAWNRRLSFGVALLSLISMLALAMPAAAHPVPFSYLDVHIAPNGVDLVVVVHIFDAAHDLGLDPPDQLLNDGSLALYQDALIEMVRSRIQVNVAGHALGSGVWSQPEALFERQSLRLEAHYDTDATPGSVMVHAALFPYDPTHQTFLNFYEGEALTSQAILDLDHPDFEYFTGTQQGILAVIRKFLPAGVHHILIGPDHLLFLVGLMLLGGPIRRLLLVVSAFTVAHSITLSLAALNLVTPPARLIEPAIALSIVCIGVDNLMVGRGRDLRAWIAFAFGFIHGFGFAGVLREMNLPTRALGWSLFSFNAGVEIGQLLVVVAVASVLLLLRSRSETMGRRLAFAGSLVVIAAGAFWFVQRLFFPGGIV